MHKDEKILKFQEAPRRLYYFDTAQRHEDSTVFVTTVDENNAKFLAYDLSRAKLAHSIQRRIGCPSTRDFLRYVEHNLLPNCPITTLDIHNAEFIWGPDLGSLKGKTVWTQPEPVRTQSYTIPLHVMTQYRQVTLSADVMKVNGIPFLMTISRHIKFGSAGKLDNMSVTTIISHFKVEIGVYASRGFRVTIILADNQFEPMRGELADLGAIINVVSRDEHVPEIERFNRTIKERVRAAYNVLPFKFVPPVFIVELVYAQVFWRNMFAIKGGISHTQSPSKLILNCKLDFNAHCKIEYGEYVQTHEEHDNSMGTCTVGAIVTRPTGNSQGGYYFIRLDTGRRINRRDWTTLPMPAIVIEQVHRLARHAKANRNLAFTNIRNEDLDVLYQNLPPDDEDDGLPDLGPGPAGVGMGVDIDNNNNDDSEDDSTYHPTDEQAENNSQSNDESSDDDNSSSDADDSVGNDANDIEFADADDENNAEIVDTETAGVEDNTGVQDQIDSTGMQDEIPGVEDENAGVEYNNDRDHLDHNDGEDDEPDVTRSYHVPGGGIQMNLHNQP